MTAPDLPEGGQELVLTGTGPVGQGQEEMLDREVVVAHVLPGRVGVVQDVAQLPGHLGLGAPVGLGQGTEPLVDLLGQRRRLYPGPSQDGDGQALGLGQQGGQQVLGGDLGVILGPGQLRGGGECLLGLDRPAVGVDGHLLGFFPLSRFFYWYLGDYLDFCSDFRRGPLSAGGCHPNRVGPPPRPDGRGPGPGGSAGGSSPRRPGPRSGPGRSRPGAGPRRPRARGPDGPLPD